jgi:hypothetical protein
MTMGMALFTGLGLLGVAAASLVMLELFNRAENKSNLKGK